MRPSIKPRAYYNEIDPFAVQWLRVLITYGLIANGDVDDRSIEDVTPSDIAGYTQCHFFAGIGGWSYALRLSGWADTRSVWTLSCPCQPFSAAGEGGGIADERHLWPAAHWLIAQRRPLTIFGEQVASPLGLAWFDTVSTDLERSAYASRVADLCAASIGAPHIRQRLYFRADSMFAGRTSVRPVPGIGQITGNGGVGSEANATHSDGWSGERREETGIRTDGERRRGFTSNSGSGECCDSIATRFQERAQGTRNHSETGWLDPITTRSVAASGATRGFWGDCDWWYGRDEKFRPIEPGVFPLAHGVSARMGKLRGYGNAIIPPLAAEFIQATEEA